MDAGTVVKVIHALVGVWLIAALVGRWITLAQAARTTNLAAVHTLLALSQRFERMVIATSIVVLVLGVATAIVQGRPFLGPFQGAGVDWLFASLVLYLATIPLVPLVFLPRGRVFAAALEDATEHGRVTDRLTGAFRDPVVLAAHVFEIGVVLAVFVLMIAKPF